MCIVYIHTFYGTLEELLTEGEEKKTIETNTIDEARAVIPVSVCVAAVAVPDSARTPEQERARNFGVRSVLFGVSEKHGIPNNLGYSFFPIEYSDSPRTNSTMP